MRNFILIIVASIIGFSLYLGIMKVLEEVRREPIVIHFKEI